MFEIVDKDPSPTVIKVVGVGGAGGNAVEHMIREGVQGVEFICANTDAQALRLSSAGIKLQFGPGLGAGGKPEKARELGILTVAVVTKPFDFEGKRLRLAEEGLLELSQHVDSLIVILNEKLMEVLGEDVTMTEAFRSADNVLKNAVGGIAEIINVPGLVNVDFEDVRTVMGEMGKAMMGSATASGVDRARIAAEQAVASPLLEGIELSGARGVLVNVTASRQLGMREVKEVMGTIRNYASQEATIIFGTVFDADMDDQLRVTVVATGLGTQAARRKPANKPELVHVVAEGMGLRTGTDNQPIYADPAQATTTSNLDFGGVFTSGRGARNQAVAAMEASGVDKYDIPAFLRKQAD